MDKKVVRYIKGTLNLLGGVGHPAVLKPIDHPDSEYVSNTKCVLTSLVVSHDDTGRVETVNTIYVPEE